MEYHVCTSLASYPGLPSQPRTQASSYSLFRSSLSTAAKKAARGGLGTKLRGEAWVRGCEGRPGYEAARGGLGTRLRGEAWVRGCEGRPGYEAARGGLGTRLRGEAWVRGCKGRPGYEAARRGLGTRAPEESCGLPNFLLHCEIKSWRGGSPESGIKNRPNLDVHHSLHVL